MKIDTQTQRENQSQPFKRFAETLVDKGTYDEVVLHPGDCFYFPAGMGIVSIFEDSISINVSLTSTCWADVVTSAIRQMLWQDTLEAGRASPAAQTMRDARVRLCTCRGYWRCCRKH